MMEMIEGRKEMREGKEGRNNEREYSIINDENDRRKGKKVREGRKN